MFFRVFVFSVFLFPSLAPAGDLPFIPYSGGYPVRFDETPDNALNSEPPDYAFDWEHSYYREPDVYVSGGYFDSGPHRARTAGDLLSVPSREGYGAREEKGLRDIPSLFLKSAAGYYSVSANPGLSGAAAGGLAAGFSVGFDRFTETGRLDIGAGARAASVMAGSAYIGAQAGTYAADIIVKPIFSEGIVSGVFGSAAGGTAAGALFAVGAFAAGSANRHEMRVIAAKSAVGSSAAAGAAAVLGAGAGAGAVSAGGLILPYVAAAGAAYFVEKMFKAFDKQEEKERIERLLLEIVP